jgi:methionine synthase II (cobalamin-independent)
VLEARSDFVGSLLRPPELLDARERHPRGELGIPEFKRVEDAAADAALPEGKVAVLGLVTTKSGRRETVEELAARIRGASAVCPLDRLPLSPQCGFATSVLGNALRVENERAKLRTIAETAAAVWG